MAKYALHPIGMMQYFWFYKILSMINTRYGPGSTYLEEESRPHNAEVSDTTEKKKLV